MNDVGEWVGRRLLPGAIRVDGMRGSRKVSNVPKVIEVMWDRLQCGRNKRRVTAMLAVDESNVLTRTRKQPRVIRRERNAVSVVEI
jgi:hypothetical protein